MGRLEDTNLHVLLNQLCPYPWSYLNIRVTLLRILEDLGQRCIRKCYLHFEVQLQYKSACFLLLLLFLFIYTRNLVSERNRNRLLGILTMNFWGILYPEENNTFLGVAHLCENTTNH